MLLRLTSKYSCIILHEESDLKGKQKGVVKIGFPVVNTDWEGDGISHLLCQVMGGQVDIDTFAGCRLQALAFPPEVEAHFKPAKYGISGVRTFTGQQNKPLLGSIIKPKTGISPQVLGEMVKQLLDGGVDFIKEDEILSNPSFCRLEDRVALIADIVNNCGRKVIYSFCINGDHHAVLERAKFVSANGGNSVHANVWCGLGVYNSIRKLDLPLFIHFQKSGDRAFTHADHAYGFDWNVICDLAGLMGVDTIHAGMWGGYMNNDEKELADTLRILHARNVVPALSCGMHPGIVDAIIKRFGNDFMANVGGAIHGHPGGTLAGAKAMRQSIDKTFGPEYDTAIAKWGKVD